MKLYIAKLSNIFFKKQEKKFFLGKSEFCKSVIYKKKNTSKVIGIVFDFFTIFKHIIFLNTKKTDIQKNIGSKIYLI